MIGLAASERGTTLIEAVVAGALLVTLVTGTASLLVRSRQVAGTVERSIAATAIAAARLERLRGIPWAYRLAGGAPEVPALAPSGAGVLDANTAGHWTAADASGRAIDETGASHPAFAVRWALWPLAAGGPEARAVEVCVFAWPVADGAPPLTCVASAKVRQP